MRHCLYLLVGVGLLGGCSSEANSGKPAVNTVSVGSNTSTAGSSVQNINPGSSAALNAEANIPSAGNIALANRRPVTEVPATGRPVLQYQPAGEDSEIASTMNSAGQMFEVRLWKRHPQLVKVQSVWTDPKNKQLTYFLRSGKVLNITTDRIVNLKQATTSQLLEIAGLPQQANTPPRPVGKKGQ